MLRGRLIGMGDGVTLIKLFQDCSVSLRLELRFAVDVADEGGLGQKIVGRFKSCNVISMLRRRLIGVGDGVTLIKLCQGCSVSVRLELLVAVDVADEGEFGQKIVGRVVTFLAFSADA